MYLIGENCVSEKKENCFVQLYQQCFSRKGVNVKNCDNAREYYAKDREFRDLCRLKRSMTKGR